MWYEQKKITSWSHHVCLVHTSKNLFTPKNGFVHTCCGVMLPSLEWELNWFSVKFVPYSMNYSISMWINLFLVWIRPINGMNFQSLGVNCTVFGVNNTPLVWLYDHGVKHNWWCESSKKSKTHIFGVKLILFFVT